MPDIQTTISLLAPSDGEKVFLKNENILVTDLRIAVHGKNIYLNQISSCTASGKNTTIWGKIKIVFGTLWVVGVAFYFGKGEWYSYVISLIAILVAIGMLIESSQITITLNSGEELELDPGDLIDVLNTEGRYKSEDLEGIINGAILESHTNSQRNTKPVDGMSGTNSLEDKLKEIQDLRKKDLITKDEFEQKKKALLDLY